MRELADQRKRFGCRRLHVLLKREGLVVNHKRTERIYREEKLTLRVRRRKKGASQSRFELPKAERPNQLWAMDFMQDVLYDGRRFRLLPVIDTFT
jgi:putative transposase